jgi:hypothetical protein
VSEIWITEEELDANPGLVKTLSVEPPRGAGRMRLVQIGEGEARSTCNPAAAPMSRAPARSASSGSPRSRRRAARTGA